MCVGEILLRKIYPLRRSRKENEFSFLFLLGDSPSGKALGSGPSIRGFESLIPSQTLQIYRNMGLQGLFFVMANLGVKFGSFLRGIFGPEHCLFVP